MYMDVMPACTSMYCMYLVRPKEGIDAPGIALTGGCGPLCGCWDLNPGLLEEKSLLLTTDLSLQTLECIIVEDFSTRD